MNEIDMVQAINGIDEKYLSESENITNVSRKKRSYKIAIIAAALLIAVPICAFRINEFLHRDNVEHYIAGAELIEQQSPGAVLNYVMKNDDFRVTVDMLLSDGHNAMIIYTAEAISENGREHFDRTHYWQQGYLSYADGSGEPAVPYILESYGYENLDENHDRDDIRTESIIDCNGIEPGKEINVEFSMNDGHPFAEDYFHERDPELSGMSDGDEQGIINYYEGIGFVASFAPNVPCNALYSSDGRRIYMSSFEIYSDDPALIPGLVGVNFIKDTGERISLERRDGKQHAYRSDERAYLIFGEFVDPDEYVGVEVNGVEYFK